MSKCPLRGARRSLKIVVERNSTFVYAIIAMAFFVRQTASGIETPGSAFRTYPHTMRTADGAICASDVLGKARVRGSERAELNRFHDDRKTARWEFQNRIRAGLA